LSENNFAHLVPWIAFVRVLFAKTSTAVATERATVAHLISLAILLMMNWMFACL